MNDDWMDVRWTKEQVVKRFDFENLTFQQLINRSGWSRSELRDLLRTYVMEDLLLIVPKFRLGYIHNLIY